MIYLLEFKEQFKKFYNKNNVWIVPLVRFIIALCSFLMLDISIGGTSKFSNPLIAVVLSVVCAFLPVGFMVTILSLFMLIQLYFISAEFAVIVLIVVILMYLLYFRFTPKLGYLLIISVFLCWCKLSYILPVAVGLCFGVGAVIPLSFGIIIFYMIKTASEYEAAINSQSAADTIQQISYITESLFNNKEMTTLVIMSIVIVIMVYIIRRRKFDNSWLYAMIVGTVLQFIILIIAVVLFDTPLNVVFIVVGMILEILIAYLCKVIFFNVDYSRTEYVQYEDDEYYYYVKAVPKVNLVNADLKVTKINARKTKNTSDIKDINDTSEE